MKPVHRVYLHPFLFLVAGDLLAISYILRCLFVGAVQHIKH